MVKSQDDDKLQITFLKIHNVKRCEIWKFKKKCVSKSQNFKSHLPHVNGT